MERVVVALGLLAVSSANSDSCNCLVKENFPVWGAQFSGDVSVSNSGFAGSVSTCGDMKGEHVNIGRGLSQYWDDLSSLRVGGSMELSESIIHRGGSVVHEQGDSKSVHFTHGVSEAGAEELSACASDVAMVSETSARISAMASSDANVATFDEASGVLVLDARGVKEMQFFTATASQFAKASFVQVVSTPHQVVVVDVSDDMNGVLNLHNTTVNLHSNSHAIFNFPTLSSLSMSNAEFKGSIVAPLADVTAKKTIVEGSLFAQSVSGDIEVLLKDIRFPECLCSSIPTKQTVHMDVAPERELAFSMSYVLDDDDSTSFTCYIDQCGCSDDFAQSWCADNNAIITSSWCYESEANCENECQGVACYSENAPTPAPSGYQCYIAACGCPGSFGQTWCTEDSIIESDWCNESEDHCENYCTGAWCEVEEDDDDDESGDCYINDCGCPGSYTESWCTDEIAYITSDWCQESEDHCGYCGTWCPTTD